MKKIVYITTLIISIFVMHSCEEILMENDITDKQVELVAPINNAMLNNTGVVFTWDAVEGATKYRLQVAKPDFVNPTQIVLDTLISATSFNQQLNIGNYQWRVKAVNSGYETVYSTRDITIVSNDDFASNTVTLLTPANNLITNQVSQNFSWQSIIGATGYQIQVLDANNNIIENQNIAGTGLTILLPEGNLQWRVRATNGSQYTMYSSRNALVDTTNPNTPVPTIPANNSTVTDSDIDFQWNRAAIAGSTEKDSIYVFTNNALTNLQFKNQATSPHNVTLNSGTYYWFVKAFDQAGNQSNQSTVFSFTVN
ncbi:hypothetical protein [Flavobacterium pedocola]